MMLTLLALVLSLDCSLAAHGGNFIFPNFPFLIRGGEEALVEVPPEIEARVLALPPSEIGSLESEVHAPLLKDIDMLSDILADVVERDSPRVHDIYRKFRRFGLDRTKDYDDETALDEMIEMAKELTPQDALGVMRTFSLALNLINAAEVHHKLRLIRLFDESQTDRHVGPLPMTEDSIRGTIDILLGTGAATADQIYDKLTTQKVEIVLTAHPTEVNRRTLLRKYRKVTETLGYLERSDLHPYEQSEAIAELRRIVSSIWGSDEIRRQKPTPQKEAAGGIAIIESVLWDAVPAYFRKLDAQLRISLDRRLPVDAVPIRFASWIGGDRDGNPNVTPSVTKEVVALQRLRASKLFLRDLDALCGELAISSRFSPEMEELASTIHNSFHKIEKYRRVIEHLQRRLMKTIKLCEAELSRHKVSSDDHDLLGLSKSGSVRGWEGVEPIQDSSDLLKPLKIMYQSLVSTGFEMVADGLLLDIMRRVAVFGTTLVPLDIREESTKHSMVMDAITRWLGIGSYAQWDETTRVTYLLTELAGKRPLFRATDLDRMGLEPSTINTLRTFEMASTLPKESLGAYVISQAQTASDVLLVMLLQRQFGMTPDNGNMMRVVPLFETLDDLNNAAGVLDSLFSMPAYIGAIKGRQEVMVGYSDSAKDAGRLAACWVQYNSQERMVQVAKKHCVELTFFHGKGGTVGRGGNPALYRAILAHPPHTVNGRFRVTEQGEMITQNFGAPNVAERTLDIYTAAILREAFVEHVLPSQVWRSQMEKVSGTSCAEYRHLVREEPRFVQYFRQATPEVELGRLNIGSRPAKRNPKGGIESLRAIPWTFAWTQTRTHLSAWLGVGSGLKVENDQELDTLRDMYGSWPWFRETIDLIAMILAKTDFSVSENYDTQLVEGDNGLGREVREKLVKTRQAVLAVTQSGDVGGAHMALLRASSTIRNPYVDPINVVQAEVLKRLRRLENELLRPEQQRDKETLQDALIVSISGIAQGMRNSG